MRLHRIHADQGTPEDRYFVQWAGSLSEIAKHRKTLLDKGVHKNKIISREHEVPTTKAELIAFLNLVEGDKLGTQSAGNHADGEITERVR